VKKAHKALAIQMTKDLLTKYYPDKLSEVNKLKKKDDIADSFLFLTFLNAYSAGNSFLIPEIPISKGCHAHRY
jgi:hypothetical protein